MRGREGLRASGCNQLEKLTVMSEEPRAPARGFFKEKAFSAIHPRSSERGILAF